MNKEVTRRQISEERTKSRDNLEGWDVGGDVYLQEHVFEAWPVHVTASQAASVSAPPPIHTILPLVR